MLGGRLRRPQLLLRAVIRRVMDRHMMHLLSLFVCFGEWVGGPLVSLGDLFN